eukprot:CAMPEP_0179623636 /NCGR_PEP_ID=MMETSP0932-20121108/2355_1 /TAXON_ID=548131 ORGANISM="Ostreococcus mediterraneus, Strain clade-D-RCC2596" /NCGR_SAMPLE_ID=MMETSP0932 /ASSEMBLY_ACC=CAM_ASM_000582 /LENGTH=327 /DNA_ID=CAMNT_0021492813 /DNA_START=349 /DNA_END=1332 /DNA_ORIENTATION=-
MIITFGFAIFILRFGILTLIRDQCSEPKIVLILAPKPSFSTVPQNLLLWRNIIKPLGGNVLLLLNNPADRSIATDAGFLVDYVKESENGLPLLSSVMQITAKFTSAIVGFCNSDLKPTGSSTKDFFQYILSEQWRNGWLENEIDVLLRQKGPAHKSVWLLVANRMDYGDSVTDRTVHTAGGIDMWIWNEAPLGILGFKQSIPAFRVGRPFFDNWLTAMAIQVGKRHVIDATLGIDILHKKHLRFGHLQDWSNRTLISDDQDWFENQRLAETPVCLQNKCLRYQRGFGTACEAVFQLKITNDTDDHPKYCLTKRRVSVPCPKCSHCYA